MTILNLLQKIKERFGVRLARSVDETGKYRLFLKEKKNKNAIIRYINNSVEFKVQKEVESCLPENDYMYILYVKKIIERGNKVIRTKNNNLMRRKNKY